MRIIEIKVYTIDEHPEKELCFKWMRNNWHDLNYFAIEEIVESIIALSKVIGGTVDYEISQFEERDEFILFKNYDDDKLQELDVSKCPLTGCCYDIDVIECLRNNTMNIILKDIHKQSEYVYSDKGLYELCENNDYEFTIDGNVF